jgi:hypothetical protein
MDNAEDSTTLGQYCVLLGTLARYLVYITHSVSLLSLSIELFYTDYDARRGFLIHLCEGTVIGVEKGDEVFVCIYFCFL